MRTAIHLAILTFVFLLLGCGGGGGVQNEVLFSQSVEVGPLGGAVADPLRQIEIQVPLGALTTTTNVSLEVGAHQRHGFA